MNQGRSLRLFLLDGTPNGLLTAEIMNWTGHVQTCPCSKLAELVMRPECAGTSGTLLSAPTRTTTCVRGCIENKIEQPQRLILVRHENISVYAR